MLGVGLTVPQASVQALLGGGGGGRLLIAANRGKTGELKVAQAADRTNCESRTDYVLGIDTTALQVALSNYYLDSTGSLQELGPGNVISIRDVGLEVRSGEISGASSTSTVLLTFSGNSSVSLSDGEPLLLSDPIQASMFGLSKFSRGGKVWLRVGADLQSGSSFVSHAINSGIDNRVTISNSTTDQIPGVGPIVTQAGGSTGTGITVAGLFGVSKSAALSVVTYSDSIFNGSGDNVMTNNVGGGLMARGLANVNGLQVPWFKGCRGGDALALMLSPGNMTKRFSLLPYATDVIIAAATNDLDPSGRNRTGAQALSDLDGLIANVRAAGFTGRIHGHTIPPLTTSTDGWATVGNQTPKTGMEAGGNRRDVFNNGLFARVGTSLYGVIDTRPHFQEATSTDRWPATGTTDGYHPSVALHTDAATAISTYFGAITP